MRVSVEDDGGIALTDGRAEIHVSPEALERLEG